MPVRLLLGAAAAIGGIPILVLLVLLATGAVAPGPAIAAIAMTAIPACGLAVIWTRDMHKLAETLRTAGLDGQPARTARPALLVLPPLSRLAGAIERLARSLADRAGQVERLLRANDAIIERLPDLLLVLGTDGSVRRANAAARAAFGPDIAAVVRHPSLRGAIEQAFAQGTPQAVELVLPVPVRRELQAVVLVMDPPLADGGQAVAVFSDRTRERAVERIRADFVANASHELRTPLASLIGFIDTLRGPAADDLPAQQRFLGIMAEQAERMNRLIDDLLSLSRVELTEHQPPGQPVNVVVLAERIVAAFEPRLRVRAVTLELQADRQLPSVIADGDQIEQVLQNLVENAVKYGRERGHVRLRIALAGPGGRWPARPGIVLSVRDDGPGIPKAHVPRLTERFYRVDQGRGRAVPGTGLGLAIVKHIVNRHRGQLVIESEEGAGSTFTVWLPQEPDRVVTDRLAPGQRTLDPRGPDKRLTSR